MSEIDAGVLVIYCAILLCVANAVACHFGAWQVQSVNAKYMIGAFAGNFITFASIFAFGIACIYYDQYPVFGIALSFFSPAVGSMLMWLGAADPTHESCRRARRAAVGLLHKKEEVEEIEWVTEDAKKEAEGVELEVDEGVSALSPVLDDRCAPDKILGESGEEWQVVSPAAKLDGEPLKKPPKTVRWET
ncbi:hypothetical protein F4781DRAFT_434072 [Annulohypoxylon bovei var. microspora]|nr:hypothetical protein F4781DRAFT_434072 [Annulohypoxylon bovei var. microspora]